MKTTFYLLNLLVFATNIFWIRTEKIAIVSLYDKKYEEIGKYSNWNKRDYANLHKYDLYLYQNSLDESRPTAWSKIKAIEKHLSDYDWIMWSDADSLIMNNSVKLETLIDNNYDMIITYDQISKVLNTGVFLIKNSEWSKVLLKNIYSQTQFINHIWWENMALIDMLEKNPNLKTKIKVIDQRSMNSYPNHQIWGDDDFIAHFPGPNKPMKEYYLKSLSNNFLKLIKNLNPNELQKITGLKKQEIENLCNLVFARYNGLELGWYKDYYDVLSALINKHNLEIGCEIGVAFGGHSERILYETNLKKLFSIDIYKHFPENLYQNDPMNMDQSSFEILYRAVKSRLSKFKNRSELLRLSSVEASKLFKTNHLDFVFIDANHSYKNVLEDLQAWYPKVRKGGLMIGDDYIQIFPGVIKAVNEFFKEKNIKINLDKKHPRIWYVFK